MCEDLEILNNYSLEKFLAEIDEWKKNACDAHVPTKLLAPQFGERNPFRYSEYKRLLIDKILFPEGASINLR